MKSSIAEIIEAFGILIALILLFYFFIWNPNMEKQYEKGLNEAKTKTDTLIKKGKPEIFYRDTSFSKSEPVQSIFRDSSFSISSSFDSIWSGPKDTLKISAKVTILGKIGNKEKSQAIWKVGLKEKRAENLPDTLIIHVPKFINETKKEINWTFALISYLGGIISSIILFFLAK